MSIVTISTEALTLLWTRAFFGQSPLSMYHSSSLHDVRNTVLSHISDLLVSFCKESELLSLPSASFPIKYWFCSYTEPFSYSSHSLLCPCACYSFAINSVTGF